MSELPKVSVVIINLNGKEHLRECFNSLQRLSYPKDKLEVIVVDNGSTDDSVEFIHAKYNWIKVIKNVKNEGFAKPSDDGARAATGEYVAFINNDMKVRKDWLIELINSLKANKAQCAGSVILNWNGELLDFAGGSVNFYGMGYQIDFQKKLSEVEPLLTQDKDLLFACGGAMIIDRKVFLESGGFDEDYFAYFEDVDLGWRLNVLGYKVVLSVKSRVYHKHHSTGNTFAFPRMWLLYQRNSLYTIYKNYGEELLNKIVWPTILMNNAMIFTDSKINSKDYDLQNSHNEFKNYGPKISNITAAELCALNDFIKNLNKMSQKREFIQGNRKKTDEEIIKFIPDPFICLGKNVNSYSNIKYEFAKLFGIDKAFHVNLKRRILLVSDGIIGKKMSGPAIRYYEFAKSLSQSCEVVLASAGESDIVSDTFKIINYKRNGEELLDEACRSDIVLLQGYILEENKQFAKIAKTKYLIIDLYDPFVIENLEMLKNYDQNIRIENFEYSSKTLANQLEAGDFFIASNEKQKDYFLGLLSSFNKVSPQAYDISQNVSKLIDTVPFGISNEAPLHNKNVLKGVYNGIGKDDHVIIWGGGVWNWFDPLTLIKAVKLISEKRNDVKLFFLGVKSPTSDIPEMKMLDDAISLAKDIGIYDKYVFFNFDWVAYEERQNYLLESDIGVSCHFDTLETRFSFRTRILDYIWASLPMISTKGDYFSELIQKEKLGLTVDYQNVSELADAITSLLDDKEYYLQCKKNIEKVADGFKWNNVVKPIVEYCKDPVHSRHESKYNEMIIQADSEEDISIGIRPGSVMSRLSKLEKQQSGIDKMIKRNLDVSKELNESVSELKDYSIMMNGRFNRFKNMFRPFGFLRRIFRRRK